MLAVFFLLTGLASVGFPGTLGFISTELLVDSAVEASPYVGIPVVIAAGALNCDRGPCVPISSCSPVRGMSQVSP